MTLRKITAQNKINDYCHLVEDINIPEEYFKTKTSACLQRWKLKDYEREFVTPNRKCEDFEFLKTGKQKLYEISNIAKLKNRPIFKYGKDYQISDNTTMKRSVRCYSKVKTIEI
jgi:hypothetical protein